MQPIRKIWIEGLGSVEPLLALILARVNILPGPNIFPLQVRGLSGKEMVLEADKTFHRWAPGVPELPKLWAKSCVSMGYFRAGRELFSSVTQKSLYQTGQRTTNLVGLWSFLALKLCFLHARGLCKLVLKLFPGLALNVHLHCLWTWNLWSLWFVFS